MMPYGNQLADDRARTAAIGVASSCSIVCCSFSRTRPDESVSVTIMMTMPIVPGRKKSESRSCGVEEDLLSILIGGLRVGGAGWSGSSKTSSSVASSSVEHAGAVEAGLRERRHAAVDEQVEASSAAVGEPLREPFGITRPSRALPVCSHVRIVSSESTSTMISVPRSAGDRAPGGS